MAQKLKKSSQPRWGEHEISDKKMCSFAIGDVQFWCKKLKNEIQLAYSRKSSGEQALARSENPPENVTWSRWALKKEHPKIRISPIFPDRPIVVKPESALKISLNAQAKIFVRVPIWIKIELTNREATVLFELPTVTLSNTWFGNFADGELCYWISSGARPEIEPDPSRPYLAICPIALINNSERDLLVDKICLRVSNLSLFFDETQLWADEAKITYKGEEAISQIDFTGKTPSKAPQAKLISAPRIPVKKGIVAQTFASIKDFSGIGSL